MTKLEKGLILCIVRLWSSSWRDFEHLFIYLFISNYLKRVARLVNMLISHGDILIYLSTTVQTVKFYN